MRWDELFDDLAGEAEALDVGQRSAEVAERTRAEIGQIELAARLRPAVGAAVKLRCRAGVNLSGRLERVGPDWVLLTEDTGREALVAMPALISIGGLSRLSAAPGSEGVVAARLGLRSALRGIARDRSVVAVHTGDGPVLSGTLDRVGADFVELAVHPTGEWRRSGEVREVAVIPFHALVAVRR